MLTPTVHGVLRCTDWALLAEQKQALLELVDSELLHGLVHFLDALQDAAKAEGYPVVWLDEASTDDASN